VIIFDNDTKDISAATYSLPLSDLIVRSVSSLCGWRAKNIFASTHPVSCATSSTSTRKRRSGGRRRAPGIMQQRKIHLRKYTIKVGGRLEHRTISIRVHQVHVLTAKSISNTFTYQGNMPFYFFPLLSFQSLSNPISSISFLLIRLLFYVCIQDACVWSSMP
jgi:hypothetical protein